MTQGLVGQTLGRYKLTALVGRGGMATVYKAEHPGLGTAVAVKVLHPHLASETSFIGRFRQEAQAVSTLRHPNIVRVLDFDNDGDIYYMVMEFIDGSPLSTLLQRGSAAGPALSAQQVRRLLGPLCSALDYAHQKGLIHRDIKPANILVMRDGQPIITDYGVARIAGATSYTDPGMVVGSAHYMSPEQAQGRALDGRSDLYSLGVVLFEALTGRVPFEGETPVSVLVQHMSATPPTPRSINPSLAPAVEAVLVKALAKDPGDRYQTAAELAQAMDAALTEAAMTEAAGTTAFVATLDGLAPTSRIAVDAPSETSATPRNLAPAGSGETRVLEHDEAPETPSTPEAVEPSETPEASESAREPHARKRNRRFPRWAAVTLVAAGVAVVLVVVAGVLVTRWDHGKATVSRTGPSTSVTSQSTAAPTTPTTGKALDAAVVAGDSLLQQGKLREAAAKYQEALQADPMDDVARTRLGIAYYLMPGSPELAGQQFEMALESNAKNVQALSFLGLVRTDLAYEQGSKDYGAAEDVLQQALEIEPDNPQAKAFLGRTLTAAGEGARGSQLAEEAARAAPEDAFVQMNLGWVYGFRGQWAAAVPYDRRGVTLQPAFAQSQLQLAEALREIKLWDEAISYARTALALGQGFDAAAYRSMGHTMWKRGDTTGAKESFQRAIEKDNTDDYSYWGLGALLCDQGDYKGALPNLERAVKLDPANAGYHSWLGTCYKALQQWENARKELSAALNLDPGRADARKQLTELQAAGH